MKYAFILGREAALSTAEILAQLKARGIEHDPKKAVYSHAVLIIETSAALDAAFFHALGGSIKMAEIVMPTKNPDADLFEILRALPGDAIDFGISFYQAGAGMLRTKGFEIWVKKSLPLELKKKLKESSERAARAVLPTEGSALTSVQVDKNRLIDKGAEFLLLAAKDAIYIARTIAVQAFEEFSSRDYGRPGRDARSGMLPPKLARMMINLGAVPKNSVLLDPFCGSGTILSEAALLGYEQLIGSDISMKAVEDTKKNFAWVMEHVENPPAAPNVFQADVKDLPKFLKTSSVGAIVSEPFLGPPLRGGESDQKIHFIYLELMGLYRRAFAAFAKVLKADATVVFVFPVFGNKHINLLRDLEELGFRAEGLLPAKAVEALGAKSSTGLLYKREDQKVGREIFRFRYQGSGSIRDFFTSIVF